GRSRRSSLEPHPSGEPAIRLGAGVVPISGGGDRDVGPRRRGGAPRKRPADAARRGGPPRLRRRGTAGPPGPRASQAVGAAGSPGRGVQGIEPEAATRPARVGPPLVAGCDAVVRDARHLRHSFVRPGGRSRGPAHARAGRAADPRGHARFTLSRDARRRTGRALIDPVGSRLASSQARPGNAAPFRRLRAVTMKISPGTIDLSAMAWPRNRLGEALENLTRLRRFSLGHGASRSTLSPPPASL